VPVPSRSGSSLLAASRMYTVARGPTVIVQKTRRAGVSSRLENSSSCVRLSEKEGIEMPLEAPDSPKLVFQPVRMQSSRWHQQQQDAEDVELMSQDQKEVVRFVSAGWQMVKHELEQGSSRVRYYQEASNPSLAGFEPLDLDAWWGRQLYLSLTRDI